MSFNLPLRTEPWPAGKHDARPCPVCGKGWIPWAFSFLPCHGRCLFTDEVAAQLVHDPRGDTALAKHYGVTTSVIRGARAQAIKRAKRSVS